MSSSSSSSSNSGTSSNNSNSNNASMITSMSSAVVAVLAASAVSYYYHSNSNTKNTTTSRDIISTDTTTSTSTNSISNERLQSWNERWIKRNIKFHKDTVHESLLKYCDLYLLNNNDNTNNNTSTSTDTTFDTDDIGLKRILVPLCGKTVDMVYLGNKRKVYEVVGIDGIEIAIQEFINEHDNQDFNFYKVTNDDTNNDTSNKDTNDTTTTSSSTIQKWKSEKITLLCGDFFDITLNDTIIENDNNSSSIDTNNNNDIKKYTFDGIWDRGSLVAIQPTLRKLYIQQIGTMITKPNGKYLLATVVRPNQKDKYVGPPYSISEQELHDLLKDEIWVNTIELLETRTFWDIEPTYYSKLTTYLRFGNMLNQIYIITTK